MARDAYSVMRSICRHVALGFEDLDWNDVRPAEREGAFDRPFALVERVGPSVFNGSAAIREVALAFVVSCYPRTDEDPDEALRFALECEDALTDTFQTNLRGHGDVERVPLYDYEGVPFDQTTEDRGYCDYLRVNAMGTNRIRDAEDQRLWTVTADLRVGYRRLGRVPYGGRTTTEVRVAEMDGH